MTIDWSRMETAETRAAAALAARREAARAECRRRILAVAPETTQTNLIGAAAAGLLDPAALAAYRASVGWIAQMRAAWGPIADAGFDPADDALWPACPPAVLALAAQF